MPGIRSGPNSPVPVRTSASGSSGWTRAAGRRSSYPPEEISQPLIGQTVSNIREDRTDLDLLYACLLDQGLGIHLPHTSRVVGGCTVHRVDGGVLAACFDAGVPDTVIRDIAASRPQWAVFRDSAFASDAAKINVTEIFKSLSPGTRVQVL